MRLSILAIGVVVYGVFVISFPIEIESIQSSSGEPWYSCETVEDLYNASSLIIRGKPNNTRIYYRTYPDEVYVIEVLELYKGVCNDEVSFSIPNVFLNKQQPNLSDEELRQCELILFLKPFKNQTRVVDIIRGVFVIHEDSVYSIGEIDPNLGPATNNLHNQGSLLKFKIEYLVN